jgi:hypothetical protein
MAAVSYLIAKNALMNSTHQSASNSKVQITYGHSLCTPGNKSNGFINGNTPNR